MRTRIAAVAVVVLVVCLGAAVPAALAQGKCSLRSFEGTYVSFDRGASVTIDLTKMGVVSPADNAPLNPLAWPAPGIVPFVNIASVTYADGVGDGYFWMFAGTARPALQPVPLHIEILEINEDCTGKFKYTLPTGATITERFIIFDNGRQYRSVPISGGIATLAWIGTGQRISKGSAPVGFCGPQTAHGSYLMSCDNIIRTVPYPTKAVADTLLLRTDVSMAGDYTGMLYEKFGMTSIETPVSGTVTVNPDCSFANKLHIESIDSDLEMRGVFFNEGKEYYAVAIPDAESGIKYSFCQGTRIGTQGASREGDLQLRMERRGAENKVLPLPEQSDRPGVPARKAAPLRPPRDDR